LTQKLHRFSYLDSDIQLTAGGWQTRRAQ